MNLITKHPRVTLALSLLVAILGIYSLSVGRIEEYPALSAPSFFVEVKGTAADAEWSDETMAKELGEAVSVLPGVRHHASVCTADGMCRAEVFFRPDEEPSLCEARLRDVLRDFTGVKIARNTDECMLVYAWTTPKDSALPYGIPDRRLITRIKAIDGVSSVEVVGCRSRCAYITLSSVKMAALGLTRAQVDSAIRSMGATTGGIKGTGDFELKIDVDVKSAEDLAGCVVRFDPKTLGRVLLGDVAEVTIAEVPDKKVLVDGEEAVLMKIHAKTGFDAAASVKAVSRVVEDYVSTHAKGVPFKVYSDIHERTLGFMKRMLWMPIASFVLVVFVLLALWRSWIMAAIPILTMIVALLSTLVVGHFMGWSLNVLTVFGLMLVSGSLVDCSLLVVDMALDERSRGERNVRRSVEKALSKSFKPIVGGTAVSVIAYLPLVFAGDVGIGVYLQFACVACVALSCSALFAITLTPVLFAAWCRPGVENMEKQKPHVLVGFWRRFFTKASCFFVDHHCISGFALVVSILALVWSVWQTPPPGMPTRYMRGMEVELEIGAKALPDEVEKMANKASRKLLEIGGVANVFTTMGEGVLKMKGNNLARLEVLFDVEHGRAEVENIVRKAKTVISSLTPSMSARFFLPSAKEGCGKYLGMEFYLSAHGDDDGGLVEESRSVLERLRKSPLVEEVACGDVGDMSRPTIVLDKPATAAFGVSPKKIQESISTRFIPCRLDGVGLRGVDGGVFVVEDSGIGDAISRFSAISVPAGDAAQIPLLSLGTLAVKKSPRQVVRYNGVKGVRFVVRVKNGAQGQDSKRQLQKVMAPKDPFAVEWVYDGNGEGTGVLRGDWKVVVLALVFLYFLLVAIYESWRIPVAATGCAAMADLGAIWTMKCFGGDFDIYAVVALMAVTGFAVKSSMIIVDAARRATADVKDGLDAAKVGVRRMFNLAQMAAWTSVAGVVPLIVPIGVANESFRTLGIAALAGLLVVSLLGLMLVPAWYAASNGHHDMCRG